MLGDLPPAAEVPSAPPPTPVTPSVPQESGVPELTMVNMYWNDLPGLLIEGCEYVRLVDIHKQMLPAKDTGILKKRCQMMALPIRNCSELQRDFLIRSVGHSLPTGHYDVSARAVQCACSDGYESCLCKSSPAVGLFCAILVYLLQSVHVLITTAVDSIRALILLPILKCCLCAGT
jgi:hypothetical protein